MKRQLHTHSILIPKITYLPHYHLKLQNTASFIAVKTQPFRQPVIGTLD